MRESDNPDFIEALARGLDVIRAFGTAGASSGLRELAEAADLTRPTTRRVLITLTELGYVRAEGGAYRLTPRVLELGLAYVAAEDLWSVARPHLQRLSEATGESCSIAQLDGADIVYVARVAVPKLVTLSVGIGTRFPAAATSLGKVLLAELDPAALAAVLAEPSRSGVEPARQQSLGDLREELAAVRAAGWALTDQQLAPGIRSVAAPVRDDSGAARAAVNVNVHALETSVETLTEHHLPHLLEAARAIGADWSLLDRIPIAATRAT